ncbi:MAG: zinc-ribbon domain-containing protein [Betaproteobacteria bacterium]|nr:zinc-ribbon domain-containing protein [Betaproteobacteria bacterium]
MTPDELFTRCPTCKTVYRTHEEQLSVQAGKVRCGQCRMVFDGRAHLVDLSPRRELPPDESVVGPPTETLRSAAELSSAEDGPAPAASATHAVPAGAPPAKSVDPAGNVPGDDTPSTTADIVVGPPGENAPTAADTACVATPGAAAAAATDIAGIAPLNDPATAPADAASDAAAAGVQEDAIVPASLAPAVEAAKPPIPEPEVEVVMPGWEESAAPPRRGMRWVYGAFAVLLLAALLAQAVFHFRHILAARYPLLHPHLAATCAAIGCTVEPLRNRDEITIESHDLQADPAHQGLLILQTTLRNQSGHPLAFPHLELELKDLGGQPIVRRVFAPVEYAGGAADFAKGIPANAEWNVKIFLDASGVSAGGYNLYLFYP